MNREDIIRIAREIGIEIYANDTHLIAHTNDLERFAQLIAQAERNKVAQWMLIHSYATGHGDSVEDLLKELKWQVAEAEREACARICDDISSKYKWCSNLDL